MEVPPRIRLDGDRDQAGALRRFALSQLEILKTHMGFQNLFQGVRRIKDVHGREIVCRMTGTLSEIYIYVPPGAPIEIIEILPEEVVVVECWCTCCFAEAKVTEVLGDYGIVGDYDPDDYPDICNADDMAVRNYKGIRYKVMVCQKTPDPERPGKFEFKQKEFVAVGSDFVEYEEDDVVIALFRGQWSTTAPYALTPGGCIGCVAADCGTGACEADERPDKSNDSISDAPDGTFIILPLEVAGVNDGL